MLNNTIFLSLFFSFSLFFFLVISNLLKTPNIFTNGNFPKKLSVEFFHAFSSQKNSRKSKREKLKIFFSKIPKREQFVKKRKEEGLVGFCVIFLRPKQNHFYFFVDSVKRFFFSKKVFRKLCYI